MSKFITLIVISVFAQSVHAEFTACQSFEASVEKQGGFQPSTHKIDPKAIEVLGANVIAGCPASVLYKKREKELNVLQLSEVKSEEGMQCIYSALVVDEYISRPKTLLVECK